MTGRTGAHRTARWLWICCLALLAAGCMGRSEPARFYILQPAALLPEDVAAQPPPAEAGCFVLGVGPVVLPGFVDRDQMVARQGDHTLTVAEFDRWAEPLDKAFARTLATNLEQLVCARPAVSYPFPQGMQLDRQVSLQLSRHDCMPGRDCVLEASWVVLDSRGDALATGAARLQQPLAGQSYAAMAAGLSQLNAALAVDVAASLRQAARTRR
ncbi:PqiC family protein [Megalodesulfovibrio gigas]|uniref:ABC-type transport auxiliary lipoprotein component domain-containing protein n=1 Tax=Megalodesulfovibrio gigas (strain ATCC 19364 / DSM 1382 / NCIMB 9332 / VKM B-1759) TaxID=1121448 RepID=T2G9R8_MEGG1|nr:PqiC family protein [Megalodesulfovibrio gigas]AGW12637.1 hypothetical protein DGI_0735 [Megalodesulfovibrio gigas DSM 1382 = ATCC 19364]